MGLATIAVTVVALAGLLGLQWATAPALTRETVTTRAQAIATAVLDETPGVIPVAAEARFPLSSHVPDELFVLQVEVLRTEESGDMEDELAALVLERLRSEFPNADPRVAVDVVGAH
ncbi:hypothetical protein [Egicoccus sp. AB-alg2]|uniref:hypothetical protein n=1 Tax=Egicoccus sp. AB-alg2 TaxID=3242693 RepID=UPI00359D65B4